MTLVSIEYYLFLAAILLVYYLIPTRGQWCVLLAASICFFCIVGTPWTIIYLLVGVLVTWLAGRRIEQYRSNYQKEKKARAWLIFAILADLGMLAALKYSNFVLRNAGFVFGALTNTTPEWSVDWPAALGISFYTLQLVGYLLDSYWGISESQMDLGKFALFSCFFPQMVSGPIGRYRDYRDQLFDEHPFDWNNIRTGSVRIIAGIFKKVAVAENFAIIASHILDLEYGYTGPIAFGGMIAYIIQIYADFAGCMDIVLGTAICFGITMPENFNAPFSSKSIQEFWQRWHITLGLWLKDYVMYPLLRTKKWNRMTKAIKKKWGKVLARRIPTHLAMLVLWFCMGLWHGGGWNYIIEGIWFWAVIVAGEWLEPCWKKMRPYFASHKRIWPLFQRFRTIVIYGIGAMFFKFASVGDGCKILFHIFAPHYFLSGLVKTKSVIVGWLNGYEQYYSDFLVALFCALIVFTIFILICWKENNNGGMAKYLKSQPISYRVMVLSALLYITLLFGVYGSGYDASMFIYGGF